MALLESVERVQYRLAKMAADMKHMPWVLRIPGRQPWLRAMPELILAAEKALHAALVWQRDLLISRLLEVAGVEVRKATNLPPPADPDMPELSEVIARLFADQGQQEATIAAAMRERWEDAYLEAAVASYAAVGGSIRMVDWRLLNERVLQWLENRTIPFARAVTQTTHDAVIRALMEGYRNAEGVWEMVGRLQDLPEFSVYRAEMVARTEMTAAANGGTLGGWAASGLVSRKQWLTAMDGRQRASHARAHLQVQPLDQPFRVGNALLQHPGDNSLGAPAEEVINCRCAMAPVLG